MIKRYENLKKNAMLDYLGFLMLKASSYSWPIPHTAKQIKLCHLEWTSSNKIRDKAVTFFKHSDLCSNQTTTKSSSGTVSSPSPAISPNPRSSSRPEAEKTCRQWSYYGSCACNKSHHKCRICTKDHPLPHCPKRRNPIPAANSAWLQRQDNVQSLPTLLTSDRSAINATPIIKHILASQVASKRMSCVQRCICGETGKMTKNKRMRWLSRTQPNRKKWVWWANRIDTKVVCRGPKRDKGENPE